MNKRGRHHLPVIIIAACALVVIATLLLEPRIVGYSISAHGGTMSQLDLEVDVSTTHWVGVYGNITNTSTTANSSVSASQVIAMNQYYGPDLLGSTLVAASTLDELDWSDISPAAHSQVNNYLGLATSSPYSAQNTFQEKENFTIGSTIYELWSATTSSFNGTYMTGALNASGELVFITRVSLGGYGFTSIPTDYQILLPVNGTDTYYFTLFEEGSTPPGQLVCNESFNITAETNAAGDQVTVDWNAIAGADDYEIHYIEGPSNGYLNFTDANIVVVGSGTTWTDTSPSQERYYKVNALAGGENCLSNETAGTLAYNLTPDYNLISNPFLLQNNTVAHTLKTIDGSYYVVNEFSNDVKTYGYYLIVGSDVFSNFDTIKPGFGYWVVVDADANLRLAGKLSNNITMQLSPDYNLVGFPTITNTDNNNSVQHVLSSIDGSYYVVNEFSNDVKTYGYYLIVGSDVFSNFDTIKPGFGYWVVVDQIDTLTYTNSP